MTLNEVRTALTYIPADDRDDWIRVCFGLKNEFGEEAFEAFDAWSRTSPKYNRKSAASTWRHTKIRSGGVTIGTIIKMAKQGGWRQNAPKRTQTPRERRETKEKREARIREDEAKQARINEWAANKAKRIIAVCQQGPHEYLTTKGFPELKGLVIRRSTLIGILRPPKDAEPLPRGDPLVIPLRNIKREVTTTQFIFPRGEKRFLGGGKFGESAHSLGTRSRQDVWLCEGFATALSVQEALRLNYRSNARIVATFSTNNLIKVAKHFRKARIIADHDKIDPKTGKRPGAAAAEATGFPYWTPPDEGTDANDAHLQRGIDWLAKELMEFIAV